MIDTILQDVEKYKYIIYLDGLIFVNVTAKETSSVKKPIKKLTVQPLHFHFFCCLLM